MLSHPFWQLKNLFVSNSLSFTRVITYPLSNFPTYSGPSSFFLFLNAFLSCLLFSFPLFFPFLSFHLSSISSLPVLPPLLSSLPPISSVFFSSPHPLTSLSLAPLFLSSSHSLPNLSPPPDQNLSCLPPRHLVPHFPSPHPVSPYSSRNHMNIILLSASGPSQTGAQRGTSAATTSTCTHT